MNKSVFLEKLLIGGAPLSDEAREEALNAQVERKKRNPDTKDNFGEAPREIIVFSRGHNDLEDVSNLTAQGLVEKILQTDGDSEAEGYLRSRISREDLEFVLQVFDLLAEKGMRRSYIWPGAFRQVGELYTSDHRPNLSEVEVNKRFLEFAGKNQAVTESAMYGLSEWLKIISKSLGADEEADYWSLWDLLLPLAANEPLGEGSEYVNQAINRSMGKLAEAVLNRLWQRKLKVGDDVDNELLVRLRAIASGYGEGYILGRLMLATQLNPLFALVPDLARQNLIARMNWNESPREACALWEGFLWTPTFSYDLWDALKDNFLTAVPHASDLGMSGESFAHVFAFVLTENPKTLSDRQIRTAFNEFNPDHLADIGQRFRMTLEAKGIDKNDVWANRIAPWIEYWPNTRGKITPQTSKALSMLIVVAENAADDAFDKIDRRGLLIEVEFPGHIFRKLLQYSECDNEGNGGYDILKESAVTVVRFLDKIVPQNPACDSEDLGKILDILYKQPAISQMPEMVNLLNRIA